MENRRLDKEAVRAAINLEELANEYGIEFDQSGRAKCPFPENHHNGDANPSLRLDRKKGRIQCFSQNCFGKSGSDLFGFYGAMEGVDFPTSLKQLAERVGLVSAQNPQVIKAEFEYRDIEGALLYQVVRREPGKQGRKKDFVERIEGHPLGRILKSRIFEPLEMTQTGLADPEAIIPHRASGYWVNKVGELINRNPTETSSTLGAGGVLSSVYDLVKWDAALYGNELLCAESKETMWTPVILLNGDSTGYGFGWSVKPYKELASQSHGGQVAGFVANFSRFPDQEAVVIVFMNRYRVGCGSVKEAVLHTFIPSLGPIPE
jgi:hypothetical protein